MPNLDKKEKMSCFFPAFFVNVHANNKSMFKQYKDAIVIRKFKTHKYQFLSLFFLFV